MNNEPSTFNPKTTIDKLRNILKEYKGRPLDEDLSGMIENVCLGIKNDFTKGDDEIEGTLKNDELSEESKDILERRKRGRRKNDNIIYAIGVGLSLVDRDSKIIWVNKTICDWMVFNDSPVGNYCHDFYHCVDVEGGICPYSELFKGEKSHIIEAWITGNSGKRMRIQHIATPITNENGNIENVLLVTIDVTEREKFVQRLLLLQQLGKVMQGTLHLDKLLHLILTCVTAGYAFGFNRAMLFLVNREQNVLKGKLAVGSSSPEEASHIWQEMSKKYSSLKNILEELDYSHYIDTPLNTMTKLMVYPLTDRKEIVVACVEEKKTIIIRDADNDPRVTKEFKNILNANEFVCVPLMVKKEPKGVIVADNVFTKEPITDDLVNILTMFANQAASAIENVETYKRLEDKMDQLTRTQQKLIRSEKLVAIGTMAAYVAHEIRNPLVTIGGFAKSLSRFKFEDSRIKTNIDIVVEEVKRLEKILNNFTDLGKSHIPEKSSVQICKIIESTCTLMKNFLQEKRINLYKEFDPEIPRIMVDPVQIKQVFLNIIMNAIESMPNGGDITVKIKTVNEIIRIDIIDTGKGMPQDTLQKIFDPFFTTKSNGTGVGLAVSLKIIEDNGGNIDVKSESGKGTAMTLSLPIN